MTPLAGPSSSRLATFRLRSLWGAFAAAMAVRQWVDREIAASGAARWLTARPKPESIRAAPRDFRPADAQAGRQILAGAFVLAGGALAVGPRGDPFDQPSPNRRFAVALHRFGWLPGLLSQGEAGAGEALRLTLAWSRLFGRWNAFAWEIDVLERRVFNLACAARAITNRASDLEAAQIAVDLSRQARRLLSADAGPARAAERACAAAVAGTVLSGKAGRRLLDRALARLSRTLPATVSAEGGHVTRSPQAALELLFDLTTLEDGLSQIGAAAPDAVSRAIDGLASAVRFFTLNDGGLAGFQGGEALPKAYVTAARAQDEAEARPILSACNGYHRLAGPTLQAMVDGAAPAAGTWSLAACGQPLAVEVLAGHRRLVVGAGWSPDAQGPQAVRLVDAASTAALGDGPCGEPLRGFAARILGPRLVEACREVAAVRTEAPGAQLLEMSHDGWVRRLGLRHERRLYLDTVADELRGEDRFSAPAAPKGDGRRFIPFVVRFHLHPDVSALVARDKHSVLLKIEGEETGWQLRSDAMDTSLEPSVHYQDGEARRTQQIVLRGQARLESGGAIHWKLSAAEGR